ncbi:hypothetical protein BDR03DRAFT_998454, partial [Suillus americanus]
MRAAIGERQSPVASGTAFTTVERYVEPPFNDAEKWVLIVCTRQHPAIPLDDTSPHSYDREHDLRLQGDLKDVWISALQFVFVALSGPRSYALDSNYFVTYTYRPTVLVDTLPLRLCFTLQWIIVNHSKCILVYDHIATLTEEIIFIWYRPKALSAMLFLLNRYIALLGTIYALLINFLPVSEEV